MTSSEFMAPVHKVKIISSSDFVSAVIQLLAATLNKTNLYLFVFSGTSRNKMYVNMACEYV